MLGKSADGCLGQGMTLCVSTSIPFVVNVLQTLAGNVARQCIHSQRALPGCGVPGAAADGSLQSGRRTVSEGWETDVAIDKKNQSARGDERVYYASCQTPEIYLMSLFPSLKGAPDGPSRVSAAAGGPPQPRTA